LIPFLVTLSLAAANILVAVWFGFVICGGLCDRGSNVLAAAAAAPPVPWEQAIASVATAVVTVVA